MRLGLKSERRVRIADRFFPSFAVGANTDELVIVLNQFEAIFRGDFTLKYFEGFKLELNDFFAPMTDQVIVVLLPKYGLIPMLLSRENGRVQQTCLNQQRNCSVHGRARSGYSLPTDCPNQIVYFEVTSTGERRLYDRSALGSQSQGSIVQHTAKSLHGSRQRGFGLPIIEITSHLTPPFSRTTGHVNGF
jgi:hypothetical protein